jgi:hypothetical protein
MTVRVAELAMAILMGVFSLYLMYKSAELPVGWIEDEGPGGGAWPFWLSVMMLLSCVGIIVNWARRKGTVAVSEAPYIERGVLVDVGLVALSLIVTVGLFSFRSSACPRGAGVRRAGGVRPHDAGLRDIRRPGRRRSLQDTLLT